MNDGVQGKVFVGFIVDVDGFISNVRVIQGLSPEIDNEAIRVVKSLPRLTPAQINGRNCRSTKRIAVNFRLQ
ncbi:MAG: energy transducer TonB [Brumimicrobium sp.]